MKGRDVKTFGDNVILEFREQWSQVLGGYNWYTFHPLMFEFEWDKLMGGLEINVVVLGLGFRFRWNFAETEALREVLRRRDEVLEGHHSCPEFQPTEGRDDE